MSAKSFKEPRNWAHSSERLLAIEQLLPGGVHYNFRFPWREPEIIIDRGEGSRVWDIDQQAYLDMFAAFGALILGHGDHEYTQAIYENVQRSSFVPHTVLDEEVTHLLKSTIPCCEAVRFGVTGTESVQNAIRIARAATGRERFVRFLGHYHGHSDNVLGGRPEDNAYPIPKDFEGDFRGSEGVAKGVREQQTFLLPWNDPDALETLVKQNHNEIAAILTEPIALSTGGIFPKPDYLELMRRLCDRYGIILIFDEVVSGVRAGLGGAQKRLGVTPDMAVFAKAIGGGALPMAAMVGRRDLLKLWGNQRVAHGGTFNGYPLGLAAIKHVYHRLSVNDGQLMKDFEARGKQIMAEIERIAKKCDIPMVVQGIPGCIYYHVTDTKLNAPHEITKDLMRRNLIVREKLALYGILTALPNRFFPSASFSEDDLQDFGDAFEAALLAAKPLLPG